MSVPGLDKFFPGFPVMGHPGGVPSFKVFLDQRFEDFKWTRNGSLCYSINHAHGGSVFCRDSVSQLRITIENSLERGQGGGLFLVG